MTAVQSITRSSKLPTGPAALSASFQGLAFPHKRAYAAPHAESVLQDPSLLQHPVQHDTNIEEMEVSTAARQIIQ